jgi:hypothetical protein
VSTLHEQMFCPIRKAWVTALPEEKVRQRILSHMIKEKGFPSALIAVEQHLRYLPHLSHLDLSQVPNRRADIVCFAKGLKATLHPLLIVECKAIKLVPSVMNQVVGYNHFVQSYFIAIVNHEEIRTGWYDVAKKDYAFVNFLPSYSDLMQSVQN